MTYDLRPLSLAELLDRAFGIYRRHFPLFVGIMALPSLVMLVLSVGMQLADAPRPPMSGAEPDPAELIGAAIWGISAFTAMMILYWVTYAVALGGSTYAVSKLYREQAPTIAESYGSLRGRVGRLAWLLFIVFVRLFGVMLLFGIAAAFLATFFGMLTPVLAVVVAVAALAVAMLLFCWMVLRYSVVVPPAVLEDNTARESVRRSIDLTRGHLLRVLVVVVFSLVVNYAALMLLQGPFFVAAVVAGPETAAGFWLNMAGVVMGSIAAALTSPLGVVLMAVLYYDLRIRKEGLDLEMMISDLRGDGAFPPAPPDSAGNRGLFFPG